MNLNYYNDTVTYNKENEDEDKPSGPWRDIVDCLDSEQACSHTQPRVIWTHTQYIRERTQSDGHTNTLTGNMDGSQKSMINSTLQHN